MSELSIENAAMRVVVDPTYGARVLALIDRRTGRDWIAKGAQSANTGEDAAYLADEAVGWDECFPTVSPWDARGTSWGRRLRDHGELWGRNWSVDVRAPDRLVCSFNTREFRFSRALTLERETMTARYHVENVSGDEFPFMWALHGLLAVTPEDRIALAGVDAVDATFLTRGGQTLASQTLSWPGPGVGLDQPLDVVEPVAAHFAGKFYASDVPSARASVGGRDGSLEIAWDNSEVAHLGLWLNYGGWPVPGDLHHLALEPTTAPVDHLGQALEQGTAIVLAPGAAKTWSVTLTIRSTNILTSDTDPTK